MIAGRKISANAVKLLARLARNDRAYSHKDIKEIGADLYSENHANSFVGRLADSGYLKKVERGMYELDERGFREIIDMEKELEL